jgi:hypothetical protein
MSQQWRFQPEHTDNVMKWIPCNILNWLASSGRWKEPWTEFVVACSCVFLIPRCC